MALIALPSTSMNNDYGFVTVTLVFTELRPPSCFTQFKCR
jgi:hypothetical protein